MDSKYPGQLDDDSVLIRVDDNITEIGGDAINGLRSAVYQIQETLGIDPQGSVADVVTRLDESLESDGSIKAAALAAAGLVTLPITNSQMASNAAVEESKLDLNYGTTQLKTWIDELRVYYYALNDVVSADVANMTQHVAHPGTYGRHQTRDLDGYTGKYINYNLQGIITDLDTRIIDHVTDIVDAHDASAISVDDSNLAFSADDAQTAIQELNDLENDLIVAHSDRAHSNGMVYAQKVKAIGTQFGAELVASSSLSASSAGAKTATFSSVPTGFADVKRGDILFLEITGGNNYSFTVDRIAASSGVVYLFEPLPESYTAANGTIYKSLEEKENVSSFKLAYRQKGISGFGGSIIQMVHPNAPYIIGNLSDLRNINSTNRYIKLEWESGSTEDIDVYGLLGLLPSGSDSSNWTVSGLVEKLNVIFSAESAPVGYSGSNFPYHYPLVAFEHEGKLGIAYDEVNGYVKAVAPTSNSAWSVLGFIEDQIGYGSNSRQFFIDGYSFTDIRIVFSSGGETQSGTSGVINLASNPVTGGVPQSGIIRLKNSSDDGTYVFNNRTSSTISIDEHISFSNDSDVSVTIYADSFSVPLIPNKRTMYELFIDGYQGEYAELKGAIRLEYGGTSSTPSNPQRWFDIVEVSRNHPALEKRINIDLNGVATYGDRGSLLAVTNPGPSYTLPTSNAEGHVFRLYDGTGINYIDLEIVDSSYASISIENAIDVDVYDRVSEEDYLLVGQALHNRVDGFKKLCDRRLLGSIGRKDIRNDFVRDYITYPKSLLHSSGVISGMGISGTVGNSEIEVIGGQVFVNGEMLLVSSRSFVIPENSTAETYNVYVDSNGVIQFVVDDSFVDGQLSGPTTSEIILSNDKVLLGQVDVTSGDVISVVKDMRRFVGHVENSMPLMVEENDITHGSFASFDSAINYLNTLDDSVPQERVIKLKGTIYLDGNDSPSFTIPRGVSIEGDCTSGASDEFGARVVLQNTVSGPVFNLGVGSKIKNIKFEASSSSSIDYVIGLASYSEVSGCYFVGDFFGIKGSGTIAVARIYDNKCYNSGLLESSYMSVSHIYGNYCICNSAVSNFDYFIDSRLISGSEVRDNTFIVSDTSISSMMTLRSLSYAKVSGNYFTQSVDAADPFLEIGGTGTSSNFIISKNIFSNTYNSAPLASSMLGFVSGCDPTAFIISENIFNGASSSSGEPCKYAINFPNGVEQNNSLIKGNVFNNFYNVSGGSCIYIYGYNSSYINIVDNTFVCATAIIAVYPIFVSVNNNHIFSEDFDEIFISLGSTSASIDILNNVIVRLNSSTSEVPMISVSSDKTNISGNMIVHNGNFNDSHIKVNSTASRCSVKGNELRTAGNQTAAFVDASLAGNDIFIVNNHIYVSGTNPSSEITFDATSGHVNQMNKGASYTVVLDPNRLRAERSNAGVSVWTETVLGAFGRYVASDTTYSAASGTFTRVMCHIDANDVPIGAEITGVDVYYYLSTADADDLKVSWTQYSAGTVTQTVIADRSVTGGTSGAYYEQMVPTGTLYMDDSDLHLIQIYPSDTSATWAVGVIEVRVNYKI